MDTCSHDGFQELKGAHQIGCMMHTKDATPQTERASFQASKMNQGGVGFDWRFKPYLLHAFQRASSRHTHRSDRGSVG